MTEWSPWAQEEAAKRERLWALASVAQRFEGHPITERLQVQSPVRSLEGGNQSMFLSLPSSLLSSLSKSKKRMYLGGNFEKREALKGFRAGKGICPGLVPLEAGPRGQINIFWAIRWPGPAGKSNSRGERETPEKDDIIARSLGAEGRGGVEVEISFCMGPFSLEPRGKDDNGGIYWEYQGKGRQGPAEVV